MASGRKRGRPKRHAQRRAKWQHEKRYSRRFERQTPKPKPVLRAPDLYLMDESADMDDELWALSLAMLHEQERFPDGHPRSSYAARKEV